MTEVFNYKLRGRRPITLLAAGVLAALLVLAARENAPWYIWAIWVPTTAAVAFLIIRNPQSGVRISDTDVTFSPDYRPVTFALADIRSVRLEDWSDTDSATVILHDGTRHRIFSGDYPDLDTFEAELRARGVAVTRA